MSSSAAAAAAAATTEETVSKASDTSSTTDPAACQPPAGAVPAVEGVEIADDVPDFGKKKKKKVIKKREVLFTDSFELRETVLGQGAFSVVKECMRYKDKAIFAAKIITKDAQSAPSREQIFRELNILEECKGEETILQMISFFEEQQQFIFVFEKIEGGALLEHIQKRKSFTEREASEVTRDIARALKFIHSKGIAHRDLKPQNILCVHPNKASPAKLCDFNLGGERAGTNGEETFEQAVGTPEYMAPEVAMNLTSGMHQAYDKRCDIWSLGVIVYLMLSGDPPFVAECSSGMCGWARGLPCEDCAENLLDLIQRGEYEFPERKWARISSAAKDLIRRMLVVADNRITAEEALLHPWICQLVPNTPLMTPDYLRQQENMKQLGTLLSETNEKARIVDEDLTTSPAGAVYKQRLSRERITTSFATIQNLNLEDIHTPKFGPSSLLMGAGSPLSSSFSRGSPSPLRTGSPLLRSISLGVDYRKSPLAHSMSS